MRSTFFGFNIARSGLFASQRSLDIIGHNISNSETKGYSRQRLEQTAGRHLQVPGKGYIGTGVEMTTISQIRDVFLDQKFRQESTSFGEWEQRAMSLNQMQAIMNEPSENAIRDVMDKFSSSLKKFQEEVSNPTMRTTVRQNAIAFTNTLNHMYGQMEKLVKDTDFEVQSTVDTINGYAEQIASLNKQIYQSEIGNGKANDLRDKRNLLIDELSKMINIEVVEVNTPGINSNKVNILVNGNPLVSHDTTDLIVKMDPEDHPAKAATDMNGLKVTNLRWSTGAKINQEALGGELGGLIDIRDNISGDKKGVPYYMDQINKFANAFVTKFNESHRKGYGLGKNTNGVDFFDPTGLSARSIKISDAIDKDVNLIAAAGLPGGASSDNQNLMELNNLFDKGFELPIGSGVNLKPKEFMNSMISNLGVDAQAAIRLGENQGYLLDEIDGQRMSISGVHLDEEMSNMVKFQHAYNASARMITTMDEMIDVIINRMGRVGL